MFPIPRLPILIRLSEVDNLDFKSERGVGRDDTTGALGSVGVIRGAGEDGLLSLLKLADALIPASDDLADTDDKLEGLTAGDAGVKDGTVLEFTGVVDLDLGVCWNDGPLTFIELLDCE